jgi:hypothetical protein
MSINNKIELKLFSAEYESGLTEFHLPAEQLQFTALPANMLEATNEKHPIVITYDNKAVGFFVLHTSSRVQEYTDNKNAMLLTAFSINNTEQGKGYALEGLKQLHHMAMVRFGSCNEIVLAVNKKHPCSKTLF